MRRVSCVAVLAAVAACGESSPTAADPPIFGIVVRGGIDTTLTGPALFDFFGGFGDTVVTLKLTTENRGTPSHPTHSGVWIRGPGPLRRGTFSLASAAGPSQYQASFFRDEDGKRTASFTAVEGTMTILSATPERVRGGFSFSGTGTLTPFESVQEQLPITIFGTFVAALQEWY